MKNKILFIFLLLVATSFSLLAQFNQHKIDSLKQELRVSDTKIIVNTAIIISREFWYTSVDSSKKYAQIALDAANSHGDDELIGDAYNSLGNAFSVHKFNTEALPLYEQAKEYRLKAGAQLKVAYTLSNIARSYQEMNMYSEAITAMKEAAETCNAASEFIEEAYLTIGVAEVYRTINDNNKALEFAIKAANTFLHLNNKLGIANAYSYIGLIHTDLHNYNLALEYLLKSYELFLSENELTGLSNASNSLGIVYDELGDNSKALDYYRKSLEIAVKLKEKSAEATAYNNIGYLYSKVKDYPKAIEVYQKSIRISEELLDNQSVMNTNNNIAWVYFHLGDIDKAKEYVTKAMSYKEKGTNLTYVAESHQILSNIYFAKGDYKSSHNHLNQLLVIKDSLYKSTRNEAYMEMQVRFETERKEKEIELLKKSDEIKGLQIQRQKYFNIFWILFTLLLIGLGSIVLNNLKTKQRNNKLLSEKNDLLVAANQKLTESEVHLKELNATKDRFFSLISHDLKNPFGAILGFSELLKNNYEKYTKEEIEELIGIIHESSQGLFKLLDNLLQWSRAQLGNILYQPELLPLLPIVKQEVELVKPLADKKQIKVVTRIEDHLIVFADRNLIAVVIRNLLTNAVKFSNAQGRVTIAAQEVNSMVEVSITDTGVGIDKEDISKLFRLDTNFTSRGTADEKGTGLGLLLCKDFVEKNGGKIWVESDVEKGSIFSFSLPSIRSSITG